MISTKTIWSNSSWLQSHKLLKTMFSDRGELPVDLWCHASGLGHIVCFCSVIHTQLNQGMIDVLRIMCTTHFVFPMTWVRESHGRWISVCGFHRTEILSFSPENTWSPSQSACHIGCARSVHLPPVSYSKHIFGFHHLYPGTPLK